MTLATTIEQRLVALRQDFDQSFARPAGGPRPLELDFLSIVVAGDVFAVPLSEVRSVHADRWLVAAPSPIPELLGVCGFRGVLTPVYDLAQLLGYGREPSARWLLVTRNDAPIAFAFAQFEAHLRVSVESVTSSDTASGRAGLTGAVCARGTTLPLLHLPSLVEAITRRIKALRPSQER